MNADKRRCLAAGIIFGMVFLASIYVIQGSLLNDLIAYFQVSDSSQGLPNTMAFIGAAVALVVTFFLVGKVKKLTLFRITTLLCAVFLILLNFSTSFLMFNIVWLFIGICMGFIDTLLSSCMADLYDGPEATRMMCILHGTYGVSGVLLPLLFAAGMHAGLPWKTVYVIVAIAGIALLIYLTCLIKFMHVEIRETQEEQSLKLLDIGKLLIRGGMPLLLLAIFFNGIFQSGLITWLNRFVGVTLQSDLGDIALSFLFLGMMVSRLAFAFFSINALKYAKVAGIIAGIFMILAVPFHSGLFACIACCISSLLFGALIPCMISMACEITPESSMCASTAMFLAFYIGESLVSPIIGAFDAGIGLEYGIIFCGLCAIGTSLCFIFNKKLKIQS